VLDPIKELHSDKQVTYFVKTLYLSSSPAAFLFFYSPALPAVRSLLVDPLNTQLQLPSQSSLSIIFARRFLAYLATQA
jgi:hypothetical protein